MPATVITHAEGGGPNGGFFYVRGAHPDGPAHWVLTQVKRRYTMFEEQWRKTGSWPGEAMDQTIIKDAVRVASYPTQGSEWDMGGPDRRKVDHPFWLEHPQKPAPTEKFTDIDLPESITCDGMTRFNASGSRLRQGLAGYYGLNGRPRQMSVLYKPSDAPGLKNSELPVEHLMWAPGFFVQYGNVASHGWVLDGEPISSLTHMLNTRGIWVASLERAQSEGSHIARQAFMIAHSHWLPQLSEAPAQQARLLFLSQHLVDLASMHESTHRVRQLLQRGLRAAAFTGRLLVLPRLPCDSPWIAHATERSTHSIHGIQDARLIVTGTEAEPVCYTGVHPHGLCWPWMFVAYSFDEVVARRAPGAVEHAMWDATAIRDEAGDVALNHLPHSLDEAPAAESVEGAMVKKVESECRAFFENEELKPQR